MYQGPYTVAASLAPARTTEAGGQDTTGSGLSVVCVSVDEIVCLLREPADLHLGSPGDLLCLEACGRGFLHQQARP